MSYVRSHLLKMWRGEVATRRVSDTVSSATTNDKEIPRHIPSPSVGGRRRTPLLSLSLFLDDAQQHRTRYERERIHEIEYLT